MSKMNFSKNISLKKLNTFGIKVNCKLFCEIHSSLELKNLIQTEEFKRNKYLILEVVVICFSQKILMDLIIKNDKRN